MERPQRTLPWMLVFTAIALFAGLALAGVPLGSLLLLGLVLTCPLMMAGMHTGSGHGDHPNSKGHDHDGEGTVNPTRPDVYEPR